MEVSQSQNVFFILFKINEILIDQYLFLFLLFSPPLNPRLGWSPPSLISTAGFGFGGQLGAELTDFVILLNTSSAVSAFARGGNVTLGGNLSVAAGPIGRSAEASGTAAGLAAIFSYSKTRGLFAGVSVEGSVLVERKDANERGYGRKVSAREILNGSVSKPREAEDLYRALDRRIEGMLGGHSDQNAMHIPDYNSNPSPSYSPSAHYSPKATGNDNKNNNSYNSNNTYNSSNSNYNKNNINNYSSSSGKVGGLVAANSSNYSHPPPLYSSGPSSASSSFSTLPSLDRKGTNGVSSLPPPPPPIPEKKIPKSFYNPNPNPSSSLNSTSTTSTIPSFSYVPLSNSQQQHSSPSFQKSASVTFRPAVGSGSGPVHGGAPPIPARPALPNRHPTAVAMFDFEGERPDDLPFRKGNDFSFFFCCCCMYGSSSFHHSKYFR